MIAALGLMVMSRRIAEEFVCDVLGWLLACDGCEKRVCVCDRSVRQILICAECAVCTDIIGYLVLHFLLYRIVLGYCNCVAISRIILFSIVGVVCVALYSTSNYMCQVHY